MQPRGPLQLIALLSKTKIHGKAADFVDSLQGIHKAVYENLSLANSEYNQHVDKKCRHMKFKVGDFVWAFLTKGCFLAGDYNKLSAKKIGPMEIIEIINPNVI
ncbi:conserved hypothetical protein [Ricinus communis]|uniref:Uncharacterized protein n=1 Tax=Ricinus communis TaxID=3988 RepID=B9SLC7_RICCO|nr:conserved hypothetical protein [Ricinus communis]